MSSLHHLPIEAVALSVRQGAGLTRLRDEQGESTPVIQVANIEPTGLDPEDFVTEQLKPDKTAPYRTQLNQVLLSQFASKLRAALVTDEVVSSNAIVGSNISVVTPDEHLVVPEYLLVIFNSAAFHARLERLTGGSTIAQVSVSNLKEINIPVPPREAQLELAQAFRQATMTAQAAHRLIEAQQALIEHRTLDLWEGLS